MLSLYSRLPAVFFRAVEAAATIAVMGNIETTKNITKNITNNMNLQSLSGSMRISRKDKGPALDLLQVV